MVKLSTKLDDVIERARQSVESSDWEAQDAPRRAEADAVERSHRDARLRRSGAALPPDVRDLVVSGGLEIGKTPAGRSVERWARSDGWPVLVLVGGTGVGKSVAASWWLSGREGFLRTATAVAAAWDSTTVRAQENRELLSDSAALVMDDVGTELDRHIPAMGAALRELMECRQDKKTIITTNLGKDAWRDRYPDERLASRMTRAAWVVCGGRDLRKGT